MNKISIILPIYKYSNYLTESIDSILKQTYKNIELLIIIEKTKDSKKIEKFLNEKYKNKKIKIYRNKIKLGLAKSLNKGLKIATGCYIARMDSDDISLPNRLKIQYEYMEKHKEVDILATNSEYFGDVEGPWFRDEFTYNKLKANLLISNPICHPTIMFRKSSFDKFDLKYDKNFISEDYELWCMAISKGCIIHVLNDITLKYRKNSENMTSNNKILKKRIKSVVNTLKKYYKNTLDLELTTNEIMNLQILFDYQKEEKIHDNLIIKIVEANKIKKFFSHEELTYILGYYNIIQKIEK